MLLRVGRREDEVLTPLARGGEGVEVELEVDMMSNVLGDCMSMSP